MNHADFQKVFEDMVAHCEEVLGAKNKEYASDEDKLHNFKVAATLEGVTVPQACGGMMVKHIVSIYDMIGSDKTFTMDQWDEKIGDALNYLFLLKAILVAESSGELNWRDHLEEEQSTYIRCCKFCGKIETSIWWKITNKPTANPFVCDECKKEGTPQSDGCILRQEQSSIIADGNFIQPGESSNNQTLIDRYKDCLCPRCGLGSTYFYRCCEEHVSNIFNSICWHCVRRLHPSFTKSHATLVLSVVDGEVITHENNQKG